MCDKFILNYIQSEKASDILRGFSLLQKSGEISDLSPNDAVTIFSLLIPMLVHNHEKVRKTAFYLFYNILNNFSDYLENANDAIPNCLSSMLNKDKYISNMGEQSIEILFDLYDPDVWWPSVEKILFHSKCPPYRVKIMYIIYNHCDEVPIQALLQLLDDPVLAIQKMAYEMLQLNDQNLVFEDLAECRNYLKMQTNPYELKMTDHQKDLLLKKEQKYNPIEKVRAVRKIRRQRRMRAGQEEIDRLTNQAQTEIHDEMLYEENEALEKWKSELIPSRFVNKNKSKDFTATKNHLAEVIHNSPPFSVTRKERTSTQNTPNRNTNSRNQSINSNDLQEIDGQNDDIAYRDLNNSADFVNVQNSQNNIGQFSFQQNSDDLGNSLQQQQNPSSELSEHSHQNNILNDQQQSDYQSDQSQPFSQVQQRDINSQDEQSNRQGKNSEKDNIRTSFSAMTKKTLAKIRKGENQGENGSQSGRSSFSSISNFGHLRDSFSTTNVRRNSKTNDSFAGSVKSYTKNRKQKLTPRKGLFDKKSSGRNSNRYSNDENNQGTSFNDKFPVNDVAMKLFDNDKTADYLIRQLGDLRDDQSPKKSTTKKSPEELKGDTLGKTRTTQLQKFPLKLVDLKKKNWEFRKCFLDTIHDALSSKICYDYRPDYLLDCVMDAATPPNQKVAPSLSRVIGDVIMDYPELISSFLKEISSFILQSNAIYKQPCKVFNDLLEILFLDADPQMFISALLSYPNAVTVHPEVIIMKLYENRNNIKLARHNLEELLAYLVNDSYPVALKLSKVPVAKNQKIYLEATEYLLKTLAENQTRLYQSIMNIPSHQNLKEIMFKYLPEYLAEEAEEFDDNTIIGSMFDTSFSPLKSQQTRQEENEAEQFGSMSNMNSFSISNALLTNQISSPMMIVLTELKKGDDCSFQELADNMERISLSEVKQRLKLFLKFLNLLSSISETTVDSNENELRRICAAQFASKALLRLFSLKKIEVDILFGLSRYVCFCPKSVLDNADEYYENMYEVFGQTTSRGRYFIVSIAYQIEQVTQKSILDLISIAKPHRQIITRMLNQYKQ